MQHTHTHKAVTERVEAKKLLSRRRQSNFRLGWQVFRFVKDFSTIVIFTVFWDCEQRIKNKAMFESAETSRVGLHLPHWQINS